MHYAARLAAAANGGQILLSDTARISSSADSRPERPSPTKAFIRCETSNSRGSSTASLCPARPTTAGALRSERLPSNLPEPVTTFVGREQELAEVATLVGQRVF